MTFCSASLLTISSLPSTMLRSSTAASLLASADAPSTTSIFGFPAGAAAAGRLVVLAGDLTTAFKLLPARLGDDIKLVSLLHRPVLFQPQLAIGDALAGLHIVFHAVPGADEVHLVFGKEQAHRGLVRPQ